jgi:prophage antirepressor-like protein
MKHHGIRGKEMTNAIVLHFDDRQLVATKHGDDLLFRFRDAFDALEYGESTSAFNAVKNAFLPTQVYASAWSRIGEEYRVEMREEIIGGPDRIVRYVKEKGLYRMAMNSSSAKADRFQDWLADVAMSIRQHGCYPPPNMPVASSEDREHAFLLGLLNGITEAKKDAKEAKELSLKTYNALEQLESDVRDYITSRRFCADNRIPSGKNDINIKNLGQRATRICESEGIRYLPKARQDGDFPANAYSRDVLSRAAREIGLLH